MEDILVTGNLEIKLSQARTSLRLLWVGEADERDPAKVIRPFLDRVTAECASQSQKVIIDLTRVEFMNSSCIGMITNFVKALDDQGAHVEVVFDTSKTWQVLSKRCTATIFSRKQNVSIVDVVSSEEPNSGRNGST